MKRTWEEEDTESEDESVGLESDLGWLEGLEELIVSIKDAIEEVAEMCSSIKEGLSFLDKLSLNSNVTSSKLLP